MEDDQAVIDVIDACCPVVLEKCYHMLPPAEKAAAASTSNVDLQWIAERSSCVWTAGNDDTFNMKMISLYNLLIHRLLHIQVFTKILVRKALLP